VASEEQPTQPSTIIVTRSHRNEPSYTTDCSLSMYAYIDARREQNQWRIDVSRAHVRKKGRDIKYSVIGRQRHSPNKLWSMSWEHTDPTT